MPSGGSTGLGIIPKKNSFLVLPLSGSVGVAILFHHWFLILETNEKWAFILWGTPPSPRGGAPIPGCGWLPVDEVVMGGNSSLQVVMDGYGWLRLVSGGYAMVTGVFWW